MEPKQQEWLTKSFLIENKEQGLRLDQILYRRYPQWSRTSWQERIIQGYVWVNDKNKNTNTSYKVKNLDTIYYKIPFVPELETSLNSIKNKNIHIVFEDEHLLILNKQANLVVHPTGSFRENTLLTLLKKERPEADSFHLVHRLDRETSGLLLIAKNPHIAKLLQKSFQDNKIKKIYFVLVEGDFPPSIFAKGFLYPDLNSKVQKKRSFRLLREDTLLSKEDKTIHSPLWIAQEKEIQELIKKQSQNIQGSHSIFNTQLYFNKIEYCHTDFFLEKNFIKKDSFDMNTTRAISLVRAILHTGRTHQIRASLCSLGFPLVGDRIYGFDSNLYIKFINNQEELSDLMKLGLNRCALHAGELHFYHPITNMFHEIKIELPKDMQEFLV